MDERKAMRDDMLIIMRREEERITIFDEDGKKITEIVIIRINGGQVHIGLDADKKYKISRNELL